MADELSNHITKSELALIYKTSLLSTINQTNKEFRTL